VSHARLALVTGAGSGIGEAIAAALAEEGWSLSLSDRSDSVLGVAERLGARGRIVDVCDASAVDAWIAGEPAAYALVSCAGVLVGGSLVEADDSAWRAAIDVNLIGSVRVLRAFARLRIDRGGQGAALLVASNNAFWPARNAGPYCVSKAGVWMLAKCAASELGQHGIRVNVLAPGETETPLTAKALEMPGVLEEIVRRTPLRRIGQPADIARVARLLLSDDGSWITGQLISADGGISLRGETDVYPEPDPGVKT
jgi:3-oxoacyl-[acyl-carrier protein] reductase